MSDLTTSEKPLRRNAVILAAGKSNRFAPFTYERPKGMFRVKGEVLIERQIEQLRAAGIDEIYIVVGYMKEKFFYLERKYGVRLIVNNTFARKGNLYSLYSARHVLANTFVCCADHYFVDNPFVDANADNHSYRLCTRKQGKFREFAVQVSDAGVITDFQVGGADGWAMVGQAYLNEQFSAVYRRLMEQEIDDFGVAGMFWEEFYARHRRQLTLYAREADDRRVWEFETIDDLRQFDADFLFNVDSDIITNICATLHCHPNDIVDIRVINAGLTNVSFSFYVGDRVYVYRHPGGTAGQLINRQAEVYSQLKAREIGIDRSVIHIDESGWKVSFCVQDLVDCDFRRHEWQLQAGMDYLRRMHAVRPEADIKVFDNLQEGLRLMRVASTTKGNLMSEFAVEIDKVSRLSRLLKADAERMGIRLCVCHNDVYEPNFLATADHALYLIDWEYAGLNDPANDLACFFSRYDYSEADIERFLQAYFGRPLTPDEHRHYWAYIPLSAFYWFCWGLYKGSVGDDDGFFFLPAYRNFNRYIDAALRLFEN
ncbi:MAG: NTP transferase domain-containing protein [Paludibacteraceae bacterium]|nr:NTP transferase domain-containing protein [Paludibacteraceae bacterium]